MLSTESLRDQLDRYADGALGIEALEEWLASESWDMSRAGVPRGVQRFVQALQSAFIEYNEQKISEDDLRHVLKERRAQLHAAREATERIRRSRAAMSEAIERSRHEQHSVAENEGVIVQDVLVSVA